MKLKVLSGICGLFAFFTFSSTSNAAPTYKAMVNTAINAALGTNTTLNPDGGDSQGRNECIGCHAPAGPPLNSYGQDLVADALNKGFGRGNGGSWSGTNMNQIVAATLANDPDNDSFSNEDELRGGSHPGNVSSTPSATGGGSGGGPGADSTGGGDREILSPTRQEASPTSTLSGCGSKEMAQLTGQDDLVSEAQTQGVWLAVLLLLLPMFLLAVFRKNKPAPVPIKRRDQKR